MAARITAYLIILGFLLGNLVKIPIFRPEILVSPLDISVLILYLFAILKIRKINKLLIIFVFWLFISLLINANSQNFLSGFSYFARYSLYIFSYYPLSILYSKSQKQSLITALAIMFPVLGLIKAYSLFFL